MRRPKWSTVTVAVAVIAALVLVSPALGGPSLKKLVKKEVAKQIRKATGPAGRSFDANATLPSGQTLTGGWGIAGGNGQNAVDSIQFTPQLPSGLSAAAVHRLAFGGTNAFCSGPGQASPGHLCVYEVAGASATFIAIGNPTSNDVGADRRGALIEYVTAAAAGNMHGTWAVTAP